MVKGKKTPQTPGTAAAHPDSPAPGIRQYISPQHEEDGAQPPNKMAPTPTCGPPSPASSSTGTWDAPEDIRQLLRSLPTKDDLTAATTSLRQSLAADIERLRGDLGGLQHRVEQVEKGQKERSDQVEATTGHIAQHHHLLTSLTRHIEDLENRGRRQNIRVRGLPEGEKTAEDLHHALLRLFNKVLGRPPDTPIDIERFHRALRPRGPPEAPPRDVICYLLHFSLKEDIMRLARDTPRLVLDGALISLFNDVSQTTLQSRRALRPLTLALQQEGLQYRWLHPFGLQIRTQQGPVTVRSGEDLDGILRTLRLPEDAQISWPDPMAVYTTEQLPPQRPARRRRPRGSRPSTRGNTPSSSQEL
uniref:Uncharacterized protein n=1 Tax=Leptobrachium leishanense TaxID=445787 RepID=A0A8C5PY44_9ANUR